MNRYHNMSAVELGARLAELKTQADQIKIETLNINAELSARFSETARNIRSAKGSATGTARIMGDGFEIVATVSKRVEWDSEALREILSELSDEDADHYAKWSLEIPERKYEAAPVKLKAKFDTARTVKAGPEKFEIVATEGNANVA